MAASLDSISEDQPLKEYSDWWIEVHETNYQFQKKLPVYGQMTLGELIFLLVKEIGKH